MPNHVHFIVIPEHEDGLAQLFRWAHSKFTRRVNQEAECTGHLWQDRFFSSPLTSSHLTNAYRYVLRNPVEAGLAKRSVDYPWSSARFTFNPKTGDPLIKKSPEKRIVENLRAMGTKGTEQDALEIERSLRNNFAFGDRTEIRELEEKLGVRLSASRAMRDGGLSKLNPPSL
jgi:hypothetical protein